MLIHTYMDELVKQPTNVYIIVHTHAQGTHLPPLPAIKYPEQVPTLGLPPHAHSFNDNYKCLIYRGKPKELLLT